MAYSILAGFAPSTTEPIDSRTVAANATARYALAAFNVYEGLVVYQVDTNELYVLIDPANRASDSGWQLVGTGVGGGIQAILSGSNSATFVSASTNTVAIAINGITTQTNTSSSITFGVPVSASVFSGSFTGALIGTASYSSLTSNILGGATNYIAVWNSATSLSSSAATDNGSLFLINRNTAISGTFQVNVPTATNQLQPAMQINSDGLFIIGSSSVAPAAAPGGLYFDGIDWYMGI